MTIQQCKYVLKIAEIGSFNEAAKQLFVAQSSLSVSVKSLEQELGIKIFERSGNGVYLTNAGTEFVRYANQIVEQSDYILERFSSCDLYQRLYVCTQHYDFVADIFCKLLNEIKEEHYKFSLREMKTYDVIQATETARCDIGIIAIKDNDYNVMERYLSKRGLDFTPFFKALPHVYLRKDHPLAQHKILSQDVLKVYPCVVYEQGEHNSSFFTEEIISGFGTKEVEVSDRASLMNVLLSTDGYTIGTGIMPSVLNKGNVISVPLESEDFYNLGYIMRTDRNKSSLSKRFIELLEEISKSYFNHTS